MLPTRKRSTYVFAMLLLWHGGNNDQRQSFLTAFSPTQRQRPTTVLHTTIPSNRRRTSHARKNSDPMTLHALIYGWDDFEEDDATTTKTNNKPKPLAVDTSVNSFLGPSAVCDAAGSSIADHLTNDRDQMGSLARLAFAFRPKEHSGLNMKDIETVHVLCVKPNEIEVEAILCESLGCVSLHIPIQFPTSCTQSDEEDKFQACVLQNLQDLDVTATSQVSIHMASTTEQHKEKSINIVQLLSGSVQLPSWWVASSSMLNAAEMETECQLLKEILNEEEFQAELKALAQDALKHSRQQQQAGNGIVDGDMPTVQKARCAIVGPAGIGMKAVAAAAAGGGGGGVVAMDVLFPFGGPSKQTTESLRAAVLGAVAVAAEQQL